MDEKRKEQFYQNIVYDVWKDTLQDNTFDIDDNFFDLGGSSLQAIAIISKLSERFEVDIPQFFANPTIRNIAANLKEDANIMLRKFEQTFAFKQLKEINETEKREYQKKYAKVNNVKKEDDKYKDVLLLGATGFLGIYLLHQLLLESVATITLLIRADSMRQAQNRIKKHYEYYFGNGSYDQYSHRIKIIIGDLTLDMFGLTENEYKELANHIEAIINSAALVKHMGKNSEFELINVKIVENIVDFAKNGINKDIHHMSTIGIVYLSLIHISEPTRP